MTEPPSTQEIFTQIYLTNAWGERESVSGPGSSETRTRLLRPRLTALVRDLGVRSLLDLPCGDFNWMRFTELPGVDYIGADIVPQLVHGNLSRHAGPGRRFMQLDMLRDPLPKADLILCRDGLVHFSFRDIAIALRAMQESRSTYLLATTFTDHAANEDIATGEWRPLNLELSPFCFPPPLRVVEDGPRADGTWADKILSLYRLDDLDV
ncbi:MAG: class I SAM-dependent methyltransferase [Acidobacteriota bacterium]|nr:class I SAM-dependent methyltransferase [Acidobacteriota bacterium]